MVFGRLVGFLYWKMEINFGMRYNIDEDFRFDSLLKCFFVNWGSWFNLCFVFEVFGICVYWLI